MIADATSLTLGSIFAELGKEDIDLLVRWLDKMSIIVESGVQSVGPPAAYSLVWEWGNARQTKEGPKTTKGTNPDGETVWMSIQAPHGWISINEPEMWKIVAEELGEIEFDPSMTESSMTDGLHRAYTRIAERCLELLQNTVPINSGDLYDSLEVIPAGDAELAGMQELSGEMVGAFGSLQI